MKIAVVRGPSLNKFEMQSFEPLAQKHEIVCFGSRKPLYEISNIKLEKILLPCLGQLLENIPGGIKILYGLLGDPQKLIGLEDKIKGFDIVHTAELSSYYTHQALIAKKKGRVKKVMATVWENIPFNQENFFRQKLLKKFALDNLDHVLAVSNLTKGILIEEGYPPEKITVIYPGVDLGVFKKQMRDNRLRQRLGFKKDDLVILSVSRLVWEKGLYDLIWAAWELKKTLPESKLKFLVVGEGPEKHKLKKMTAALDLENIFVFAGSFPYDKMVAVYNLADVFVLGSIPTKTWQEQFGMVLIEAMACGLPVIATKTGTIPEVVGDSGMLIAANDWVGMARALEKMAADPQKAKELGKKSEQRVRKYFSQTISAKKIEELYEKVMRT